MQSLNKKIKYAVFLKGALIHDESCCAKTKKKESNWINPVLKISFLLCEKSLRNFKNSLHSFEKKSKKKRKFKNGKKL